MSNFFEQELKKLFGDGVIIQNPRFVGRACLGELGDDLRVRAEFITLRISDHYSALRLTVLNRTEGVVDRSVLRFADIMGIRKVSGNPNFRSGISPHIWDDSGKAEWYVYRPTIADYEAIRQAADDYLDVFRERVPGKTRTEPAVQKQTKRASRSKRGQER